MEEAVMPRLGNKTALIAGGTSGIGLETARQFVAEGARAIVTSSSSESVGLARKVLGGSAKAIVSDASSPTAQRELAQAVHDAFGKLERSGLSKQTDGF